MKHATAATLARIDGLLGQIRARTALKEKTPGVFYLRGKAFLHFHDDPGGIFADVRLDGTDFTRFRAVSAAEQKALLSAVDDFLTAGA